MLAIIRIVMSSIRGKVGNASTGEVNIIKPSVKYKAIYTNTLELLVSAKPTGAPRALRVYCRENEKVYDRRAKLWCIIILEGNHLIRASASSTITAISERLVRSGARLLDIEITQKRANPVRGFHNLGSNGGNESIDAAQTTNILLSIFKIFE